MRNFVFNICFNDDSQMVVRVPESHVPVSMYETDYDKTCATAKIIASDTYSVLGNTVVMTKNVKSISVSIESE